MSSKYCLITQSPIAAPELSRMVENNAAGAVVIFSGNVRNIDSGKKVRSLLYEIHPSTSDVLEKIVNDLIDNRSDIAVAVAHRYGDIPIGDSAFIVAVSSEHRSEAFTMCSLIVDTVKDKLPIWKFQAYDDGSSEWVNTA